MAAKNPRLEAALKLAAAGYKIFPVPPNTKKSYVAKGMRFGSGEAWGMTKDPALIQAYWKKWPKANVGLPTGAGNGIIVIETDTIAGHPKLTREGEVSLQEAQERLGKLPPTLMSESPTGSRHRFFTHPGQGLKVTAKPSGLGEGIDVQGDNKMVVVPPSAHKGGEYKWLNKLPPAALPPEWVKELTVRVEKTAEARQLPEDANWAEEYAAGVGEDRPTFEEVQEALAEIPNEDLKWEQWNSVGMRIYAWSSGPDGLGLFDAWSQKSEKYDRDKTLKKWKLFHTTPPTQYTARSILNLAEYGFDGDEDQPTEEAKEWQEEHDKKESASDDAEPHVNGVQYEGDELKFVGKNNKILIPYNLWQEYPVPDVPRGVFPKLLERFALTLADIRGSDAAGLIMGALVGCGAAISDYNKLQVKPESDPSWIEAARLWVALVGGVSAIKTSTLRAIRKPFQDINKELFQQYMRLKTAYDEKSVEDKKLEEPPHLRSILIGDSTPEAVQDEMHWNVDGMVRIDDELGHFFGSMDRYSHTGSIGADRFFWTQTYEGDYYQVRRSSNKNRNFNIENCGMSLLGGIQPSVIRGYGDNQSNEGLLQRCIMIILKKAVLDKNVKAPPVVEELENFIYKLYKLPREEGNYPFKFTKEADKVREEFFAETFKLSNIYDGFSPKLAEHINKWRGLFCRICLILHVIENYDRESNIEADTANRVFSLMVDFLLPHAEAFYLGILNEGSDIPKLRSICGYILAHERTEITARDIQHSIRSTRGLKSKEIDELFQQLHSLSWLTPKEKKRSDSNSWIVHPHVQKLYQEQAENERERRAEVRDRIAERQEAYRRGDDV